MSKTLIIGIGNRYRGDDGLGPAAARRIDKLNLPNTKVLESAGDLTSLAHEIEICDSLVLIDSVLSGEPPGTIHKIDPSKGKTAVPLEKRFSTHGLGIVNDLRLLKEIAALPDKTVIYGVEGADFSYGEELSGPVIKAIDSLADRLKRELGE